MRSQWTSDYDPTIEDSYSVTRQIDGLNYHLSLTDTAGQEEYRSLWAASNLQSDAFLLVYDITNLHSLEGLSWFLEMIDIEAENREDENNRLLAAKGNRVRGRRQDGWKFPPIKIIAGNKCDLKENRVVTSKMGWEWARSKGCGFMETSAREMVNIEETFACKSPGPTHVVRANFLLVIVKRVAEARRQGGAVGPYTPGSKGHTPNISGAGYSGALTMNPRRAPSPTPGMPPNEKSQFDGGGKKAWWKRLCCCFG